MRRSRLLIALVTAAVALPAGWIAWGALTFPSDQTPEGAYARIAKAVNTGRPAELFPYLETAAQHACYTLRDYRRRSRDRVLATYPEPERAERAGQWRALAETPDGSDAFVVVATEQRWIDRLRRDLSGVRSVQIEGERATLETVRGTRYAFRRRENGIWGLTHFTAFLVAEAERAARDHAMVERAAQDYERAQPPQRGERARTSE